MTDFWLHVPVNPEPWAIGPVGFSRRGGKMSAYVGRNQQLDAYKNAVAEHVKSLWGELPMLEGPLAVQFYFWRNRAEYTTPQARTHRKHEADATNLQKATEDALQGIVYSNDKDNLYVASAMMGQGPEVIGQVVIHVSALPDDFIQEIWNSYFPTRIQAAVFDHNSSIAMDRIDDNSWPPKEGK